MNVTLFKDVTTAEYLASLKTNSDQYIGLYVDMNIAEQRKYVKNKAVEIKDIIKAVNAARIKKTKDYKKLVDVEAVDIIAALEKANEPFTLLIEGYDAERKVILDAQKASKLAIENAAQKLIDHEFALLIDKSYLADKLAAEKAQAEHDEAIRIDATNRAAKAAKDAQEVTDRAINRAIKLDADNRLANKKHVRTINREIYCGFISAGLEKDQATKATQALIDSAIQHVIIHY
tara:strand:+ start:258 stop:956 length:699 start_codon:yes stop_codon:yes gene_type:complete